MPLHEIDELDRLIAANLRRRRVARGLSQAALGVPVRVTPQQIQKYEACKDRISAKNLAIIARVLDCKLGDFLEPEGPVPVDT
jgi:transcriptional regulator with XRE-family HTH domain